MHSAWTAKLSTDLEEILNQGHLAMQSMLLAQQLGGVSRQQDQNKTSSSAVAEN